MIKRIRHLMALIIALLPLCISGCAIGDGDVLEHLSVNDPLFIAVGMNSNIYSSTDGIVWKSIVSLGANFFFGANYGNSRFMVCGNNPGQYIMHSSVDTGWSPLSPPAGPASFRDILENSGMILLATNNGLYRMDNPVALVSTPDTLWSVAYGDEKFVAVGENGLAYASSDGVQWSPLTPTPTYDFFRCIHANGGFIAIGQDAGLSRALISVSPDGAPDFSANAIASLPYNVPLYGIAYGNRKYVAGGQFGRIYYSEDGRKWISFITMAAQNQTIQDIEYGNGLFVAVCSGAAGPIIYSEDGINWHEAYCPAGFTGLYGIARRP